MTKQEEVRELLKAFALGVAEFQEQYQEEEAEKGVDGLMRDIKGLGVVIKVDRELPKLKDIPGFKTDEFLQGWQWHKDLTVGYTAVEPLV